MYEMATGVYETRFCEEKEAPVPASKAGQRASLDSVQSIAMISSEDKPYFAKNYRSVFEKLYH